MSLAAIRYNFCVDDGVTGEIIAEIMPGGQRLTDEQRTLLERIQQLVAQAQTALSSSSGAEAMVSGVKLANAVNALKGSLANFQTAMRTGDTSNQKSTAQNVVSAATEFQKTLEGIKTANPNAAIPSNLKSLGASLAGLKDMMSQKAQVGKITRTAILRGGVTDLAAATILKAIKAIISDKTQPQAVRDALATISKALDKQKVAGQPLSVKDIVAALAGKGRDAVNAVVTALAAAKQPAATQAFVAALANIPEKGLQMAAQVITHIATVNPQAAAQIMTMVAAIQPAVIQSVAQAAIHSEKPPIVAMALAALTEVKQQQPAAAQAIQNIAAVLADKGQSAINAVAIALAEMKQPAEANPQTAAQIMTMVAAIQSAAPQATANGNSAASGNGWFGNSASLSQAGQTQTVISIIIQPAAQIAQNIENLSAKIGTSAHNIVTLSQEVYADLGRKLGSGIEQVERTASFLADSMQKGFNSTTEYFNNLTAKVGEGVQNLLASIQKAKTEVTCRHGVTGPCPLCESAARNGNISFFGAIKNNAMDYSTNAKNWVTSLFAKKNGNNADFSDVESLYGKPKTRLNSNPRMQPKNG